MSSSPASMIAEPPMAPMPMPALAPVLRLLLLTDGDAVVSGLEVVDEPAAEAMVDVANDTPIDDADDDTPIDDEDDDVTVNVANRAAGAGPLNGSVQLKVLSVIAVQHCQT
jgi:hypothetical protein